jgi:CheY-like chemotaxis protein
MSRDERPLVILMADDDAEDCLLVKEAIEEAGFCDILRFVADGEELLEYLNRNGRHAVERAPRPDLILLDLNMPRKDGREALRQIKSDPRLQDIPVVVLTTSTSADEVSFCYRNGANSFVCKPTSFRDWIDGLRVLCSYWFNLVRLPGDGP